MNSEKELAYQRNWRAKNPEKTAQYSRRYRDKNPERAKENQERYHARLRENPEACVEHKKRWAVYLARRRAKVTGRDFSITVDDIVWPEFCPILGLKLKYVWEIGKGKASNDSITLDRRDNSKGYVPGNVFVISRRANVIKSNFSVQEIRNLLDYCEGRR